MNTIYKLFLAVWICVSGFSQQASTDTIPVLEEQTRWEMLKHDGASTYKSVINAFTQPTRWKKNDWVTLSQIAMGSTFVFLFDEPAYEYLSRQEESLPAEFKEFGFRIGKPVINYGITTGVYAFGLLTKNEKVRKR